MEAVDIRRFLLLDKYRNGVNTRELGLLRSEIGNAGFGTVMGGGTFDLGLRSVLALFKLF